jgi:hypothetical protein
MRTFTISPAADTTSPEPVYSIRAAYTSPDRSRRYGELQVCAGWTRDRIVQQFLKLDRTETAFLLAQQLGRGEPVQIPMQRDELIRWNN